MELPSLNVDKVTASISATLPSPTNKPDAANLVDSAVKPAANTETAPPSQDAPVRPQSRTSVIKIGMASIDVTLIMTWVLWVVIVGIHVMSGMYYGAVAYVYKKVPSTFLRVSMDSFALSINMKYFPFISVCHAIVAAMHGVCLIEILMRSLQHRQIVFHRIEAQKKKPDAVVHSVEHVSLDNKSSVSKDAVSREESFTRTSSKRTTSIQKLQEAGRYASNIWEKSFGHAGIFGVGGKYFPIIFLIRESTETILQSIQSYQLSSYVPRLWLNRFSVAAVVISCWSTPILQKLLRKHPRQEVLLCMLFDVVLDFVSCVGIPTALALAYVSDYDPTVTTFKLSIWSDNIWYGNFVNEFKLLFIQNWYDFVSRALFAITLLLCLDDVKMLASAANIVVFRATGSASEGKMVIWNRKVEKIAHIGLVLWGCLIVGLHLEAATDKSLPGCIVQVYPWASPQTSCSYFQVNCTTFGIVGKAKDVEAPWAEVNAKSVSVLGIQSCSELHMPASIQNFTNLISIDLRFVALAEWADEAALTKKFHPHVRRFVFVVVSFGAFGDGTGSTFPPGIVSPEFPPTLQDIVIFACGISKLPSDLDEWWPKNINLMLQGNRIADVPEVLLRMDLSNLNLKANGLLSLPAKVFEVDSIRRLQLGTNPFTSLPSNVTSVGSSLSQLLIDTTNVTAAPEWMTTNSFLKKVDVQADGTPLCTTLKSQAASDEKSAKLYSYFCPGYHT